MDVFTKDTLAIVDDLIRAAEVLSGCEDESAVANALQNMKETIIEQDKIIQECKASGQYDARQHEIDKRKLRNAEMDNAVLRQIASVYEQALKRLGYELPSD